MENYDERIWMLITRTLAGEATAAEKKELGRWLDEDTEHRIFFSQIKSAWADDPGESVDASFLYDYESGLHKLRRKIEEENNGYRKGSTAKAKTYFCYTGLKVAASVVFLVISLTVFMTIEFWHQPVTTYTTTGVEQRIIDLPDGSEVRLNINSAISFTEGFAKKDRQINLEGEAYFDVAKDPDKPFIVKVKDVEVQAIGTAFNVKEGTIEDIQVAVEEGIVSFRARNMKKGDEAKLAEGEMGWLSGSRDEIRIERGAVDNYLSWMHGKLTFDDMPLHKVIDQLEHIYGIEGELQDSAAIASIRLTSQTERTSLNEVLDKIAISLDITYRKEGDIVIWMAE